MTLGRFHTKDVQISEDLDFSSLVSNPALLEGLASAGYQRPSPIQLKTIPLGRLGLDLIAQAKSGTGKTIVFSVIAIESILSQLPATAAKDSTLDVPLQHQLPRAVIIAPTREIAVQIQEVILSLIRAGLGASVTCYAMIGGMPIQKDKENLKRCSIVVGTPGRVRSLIETGDLCTSQVRLLVLDEADKLMEDAFKDDVFAIAQGLGTNKQVMAFSATYDDDLLSQLDSLVKNPVYVMLSNGTPELEGKSLHQLLLTLDFILESTKGVLQYYKVAALGEKHKDGSVFLKKIHMMESKFAELESLLTHVPFYQAIVFLNHRGRAADLVKFLTRNGWPAMHIASGISQAERLEVMQRARKFELRVLVCSDLIARGIDIDRVNLVVNLDLPKDPETYLHRIGRTGRYGTVGLAVSIVDDAELKTVEILRNDFGITIQKLSADDKVYGDLSASSKNQHHERPLQASDDVEQFKKLEAERVKEAQRVLDEDAPDALGQRAEDDQNTYLSSKRKIIESSLQKQKTGGTAAAGKKRLKIAHDKHSRMTLQMTPPDADREIKSMPTMSDERDTRDIEQEQEQEQEQAQEQEQELEHGDVSGDEDDSGVQSYPYYPYHSHAPFYPYVPTAAAFIPSPLYGYHSPHHAYNAPFPSFPHSAQTHSVYYPPVAQRPAPFFPPDLILFPARPHPYGYFR
ncbi:DEAD (Asp-Glu-Ala-Asp) box polypeptide 20 [Dissophora globulifera]|uniref:RNA helicase n=1 Tax=Dissophora globulifera TaxID=979702 RepID=A0A9P6REF6_9FUNG|nr:DEAD (Asp-Glu-Ala-Asp) box polypeptide 20 [Dissophora globulifera]